MGGRVLAAALCSLLALPARANTEQLFKGLSITGNIEEGCAASLLQAIQESGIPKSHLIFHYNSKKAGDAKYIPFLNLTLLHSCDDYTMLHEFAHEKTFRIMKKHPEFIKRWQSLSVDERGHTLYEYWFLGYLPVPHHDTHAMIDARHNPRKHGFILPYQMRNAFEDIAVLVGVIETNEFAILDDFDYPNFKAKITLAQEYGLLPTETLEFLSLLQQSATMSEAKRNLNQLQYQYGENYIEDCFAEEQPQRYKHLMEETALFFKNHPQSIYTQRVHFIRASLEQEMNNPGYALSPEQITFMITENMENLKAPQDIYAYRMSLQNIAWLYGQVNNPVGEEAFSCAKERYEEAIRNNDMDILLNGIPGFN